LSIQVIQDWCAAKALYLHTQISTNVEFKYKQHFYRLTEAKVLLESQHLCSLYLCTDAANS